MSEEKKTILIAEDEEPMLNILKDRLELEGFNVLEARNGQEGLDLAMENHPDLVMLDLVMPVMNGAEMLSELLKDNWGKSVPIMCLTNVEDVPKSIKEHMKDNKNIDYVVKVHTRLDEIIEKAKGKIPG